MDQSQKEQTALWKFGLIIPLVNGNHGFDSMNAYCRSVCAQPLTDPGTGVTKIYSPRTIKFWYWLYIHHGFMGLFPNTRKDNGSFRRLEGDAQSSVLAILDKYPKAPNTKIRDLLLESGVIDPCLSQSTVDRYIRSLRQHARLPEIHKGKDRRAFEQAHINQCWQADTTKLRKINGRTVNLMLIVDDASRLVVGYGFFFEDDAINFQKVLKKAIAIYGKPDILYTDHGGPYENAQLDLICATLGIQTLRAPVHDGSAKGKIERANKTLKARWLSVTDWQDMNELADVENSFVQYLNSDYQRSEHSALKKPDGSGLWCPLDRFLSEEDRVKKVPLETLDAAFLHRYVRKVRTDSSVQINNIPYEVPSEYMRDKINIYLDPTDPDRAWFSLPDNQERFPLRRLNKVDNAKTVRKQHISFKQDDKEKEES